MTLMSAGFSMGHTGMSYQQKLLSGSLQTFRVDAITFPFADVPCHFEVKVSAIFLLKPFMLVEKITRLTDLQLDFQFCLDFRSGLPSVGQLQLSGTLEDSGHLYPLQIDLLAPL
ncbi:hypothetical protein CB1_000504012 [Camelus ferus]|nr:hypothetical protein CB1_000504012 [Camelus ferus]